MLTFRSDTLGSASALQHLKQVALIASPIAALLATSAVASATQVHAGIGPVQSVVRGAVRRHVNPNFLTYSSYSFPGPPANPTYPMGYSPAEGVTAVGTNVYAVTTGGAAHGAGAIVEIARSLVSTTATAPYSFGTYNADGSGSPAAPILVGSVLHGTMGSGGSGNGGTFTFDTAINNPIGYIFSGFPSGGPIQPSGPLLEKNTNTYFGVSNAGPTGHGTFYRIGNGGTGPCTFPFNGVNGNNPLGNLVKMGAFYYGVAPYGGDSLGDGVVFKMTQTCSIVGWYLFGSTNDGIRPMGGLVQVGTWLYGTTSAGGVNHAGTIFRINASLLTDYVVYNFPPANGTSGANPSGSLHYDGTNIIGTTRHGGGGACVENGITGCGTVYSYAPSTTSYATLHAFGGGTGDGYYPTGVSYNPSVNGIYGTTTYGGSGLAGTIWSLVCVSCQ